jgi:transcriptional regulator with XRE-family HTH domain
MINSSKGKSPKKEKSHDVQLLAKRIKELRKKAGYTSYELFAYDHEITRSQWGRYERGEDIRFTSLVKTCKALNVTLVEFFSEGFHPEH